MDHGLDLKRTPLGKPENLPCSVGSGAPSFGTERARGLARLTSLKEWLSKSLLPFISKSHALLTFYFQFYNFLLNIIFGAVNIQSI